MKVVLLFVLAFILSVGFGQNYTSYFTGNATDVVTNPAGGVCLMGGATEDDNAMTWFLERANGGDVLVIRASGADGYNAYMYSGLGVSINSVESIVWNDATASNEAYIHQKINQAEAIWIAGGDQWNYVSYWRDTPIDSLINKAISERNIVIGGTSAGMAILGGGYFTAENGTVTSATALNDPYDLTVTPEVTPFLNVPFMNWVITDTHYDAPDRKGRHIVFMARLMQDNFFIGPTGSTLGIACDEYTAVCIDTNGIANVFGDYPTYDDNAYFIRTYCSDFLPMPQICGSGIPLTWNYSIVTYQVKGTTSGVNWLDLNDWETGSGGEWFTWDVDNGILTENPLGYDYNCDTGLLNKESQAISVYPIPAVDHLYIKGIEHIDSWKIEVLDINGSEINFPILLDNNTIDISTYPYGAYILRITNESTSHYIRFTKI